jgi:hypothetical protein
MPQYLTGPGRPADPLTPETTLPVPPSPPFSKIFSSRELTRDSDAQNARFVQKNQPGQLPQGPFSATPLRLNFLVAGDPGERGKARVSLEIAGRRPWRPQAKGDVEAEGAEWNVEANLTGR